MPITGASKVIKYGGKTGHQFCIDGYLVDEVLKQVPSGIEISGAKVEIGTNLGTRSLPVHNSLKRLGVQKIHESLPNKRAFLVFDHVNKSEISSATKKACEALNLDYKKAQFEYLLLQNKDGSGRFTRVTKEIRPHSEDYRRKLKVLGLTHGSGRVQDLISELGAKKYFCEFREEVVKLAICRPE